MAFARSSSGCPPEFQFDNMYQLVWQRNRAQCCSSWWLAKLMLCMLLLSAVDRPTAPLVSLASPPNVVGALPATCAVDILSSDAKTTSASASCPPATTARNLAIAYVSLLWARMKCDGSLHAPGYEVSARPLDVGHGFACEIYITAFNGELRLLVGPESLSDTADFDVLVESASMRVGGDESWAGVDVRLCMLGERIGFVPLPQPVHQGIQDFAVAALNANRASCNREPLRLLSHQARYGTSAIIELAALLRFFVEVVQVPPGEADPQENGAESSYFVQVDIEAHASWSVESNAIWKEAFTFLQSRPQPCDIFPRQQSWQGGDSGDGRLQLGSMWHARAPAPEQPVAPVLHISRSKTVYAASASRRTLNSKAALLAFAVTRSHGLLEIPESFDLRAKAPACVLPPRAQGRCVAGWAFAAVGSFEKQVCWLSKGAIPMERFSVQRIVGCQMGGCFVGGHVSHALNTLFQEGVVPESCAPWEGPPGLSAERVAEIEMMASSVSPPPQFTAFQQRQNDSSKKVPGCSTMPSTSACAPTLGRVPSDLERRINLWQGAPPGLMAVRGDPMIRGAILAYGAVLATVEVYSDFLDYKGGVYHRAEYFTNNDLRGVTAVQLLGWGITSDSISFWIGENSFGNRWGESGYFRWIRGIDHLGIERTALFCLARGLLPLGKDGDPAGDPVNLYAELKRKITATEARVDSGGLKAKWLVASCIVTVAGALISVAVSLRNFFGCDDERSQDSADEDTVLMMQHRNPSDAGSE
eukprot:TRINITY_DN74051_c0_g1_i1.p1 TRINITY_DN74051_c0_g1~~TRINITY_DN74051_c0_g1_i1.p1  ORF type:complete len:759 (+),score=92.75 TRINITY_DN74051_c0_g1_i1:318-2594(+)